MKELPILFSGSMVRAILEGRKTQTWRVVRMISRKGCPWCEEKEPYEWIETGNELAGYDYRHPCRCIIENCPYGQSGDRLWVRESMQIVGGDWHPDPTNAFDDIDVQYAADSKRRSISIAWDVIWGKFLDTKGFILCSRSGRFMPRWASRITLKITAVRVERLQEITEADAYKEGIHEWKSPEQTFMARLHFKELWDSLNAKRGFGWAANPWVWKIEFRRMET